jgi:hypothetical protein
MSAHEATTHDYTDVTGQLADLGFQHAQMVAENERLRADLFASLREWDLVEENELRGLRTGKIEELRKAYGVPLTTWCKLCREKGCSACGGTGRLECTANQDAIRAWLALREKE